MREVKFKFVVENHGGKYISREYILDHNGLPDTETILEDMEGPCNCHLNESVSVCEGGCQEFFDAKVIDKIQYIGLKDKNGVEIYEGDILMASSWRWGPGFVYLDQGQCGPCNGDSVMSYILAKNIENPREGAAHNIWNGTDVKVIGNIYENPELLKEEK